MGNHTLLYTFERDSPKATEWEATFFQGWEVLGPEPCACLLYGIWASLGFESAAQTVVAVLSERRTFVVKIAHRWHSRLKPPNEDSRGTGLYDQDANRKCAVEAVFATVGQALFHEALTNPLKPAHWRWLHACRTIPCFLALIAGPLAGMGFDFWKL